MIRAAEDKSKNNGSKELSDEDEVRGCQLCMVKLRQVSSEVHLLISLCAERSCSISVSVACWQAPGLRGRHVHRHGAGGVP